MIRGAGYCGIIVILAAALLSRDLSAQDDASKKQPKDVYRAFELAKGVSAADPEISQKTAEYRRDRWELISTYPDTSGTLVGIFRREYAPLDLANQKGALKELSNVQGKWDLDSLIVGVVSIPIGEKKGELNFTESKFTLTVDQLEQTGTIQFVQRSPETPGIHFEVDFLVESESHLLKSGLKETSYPFFTVRTMIRIAVKGDKLEVYSGGYTSVRPTEFNNVGPVPAKATYKRGI